jgi:hypothetical protein
MKSIGGIGGTNSLPEVDGDATRAKRNSSAPPAGSAAASARFSKPGELFSKLQQLAEQDPEKLKEVAGKIADSLHQAAAKTGGAGEFLEKLAASFDEVAKSGDLADLRPKNDAPPTGPAPGQRHIHHHHHHHHHHHNRIGGRAADIGAELEKALNMVTDALAPTGTSGPTTGTTPVETAPTAPVPTPTPEA